MLTFKPTLLIFTRILLITVILANALLPGTASALTNPRHNVNSQVSIFDSLNKINEFAGQLSELIQTFVEDATPTASPVNTETPTVEPASTESATPTSTPAATSTIESSPTTTAPSINTALPTASISPTPDLVSTPPTSSPQLSVMFTASPNSASVGDEVVFTVAITNTGQSPVTGIHFSNFLPEGLNYIGRNDGINFDARTRELTWQVENPTTLAAGQSVEFEYSTMLIPAHIDEGILVDTANVEENGSESPITVETTVLLSQPGTSLIPLDRRGGEARGLEGHVKLEFPEESVSDFTVVSIRDLSRDSSSNNGETWLEFELELKVPKSNNLRVLGSSHQENDATFSALSQETILSIPSEATTGEESDQLIPLEWIEAEFDTPVELTVSLNGYADLATLGADIAPFLVTLDENSNTWVRIPLETVDRESNTITALLPHFSTWGVGLGPSFPTNGAGVLQFDTAYPALFTGVLSIRFPFGPLLVAMECSQTLRYHIRVAQRTEFWVIFRHPG